MRSIITFSLHFASCISTSLAFSSPSYNFLSTLTNIFENKTTSPSLKSDTQRDELKSQLKNICNDDSMGDADKRKQIEELIAQLGDLSPIQETATSPLLQQKWDLVWTTEKEINFFIDLNLSGQITQTLQNGVLENNIPFQKGGSFGVKGKLSIPSDISSNGEYEDSRIGIRTEFEFESATLDLGKWGTFSFPPVGKGWFDTVYLDEIFRIDTNSRNDILICQTSCN